ncbi:uncharacterized protein B0H18DRAFT_622254, partial [Fomitopsis serialis]|uniref:uncharacterized protein n=1 Tax=Fomitopsis serialis TaxID=139415 RepID=UPI002008A8D4
SKFCCRPRWHPLQSESLRTPQSLAPSCHAVRRSVCIEATPASRTFISFYSSVVGLTRTNWRTGGHPAPQPVTAEVGNASDIDEGDDGSSAPKAPSSANHPKLPPRSLPSPPDRHEESLPAGLVSASQTLARSHGRPPWLHATDPETFTTRCSRQTSASAPRPCAGSSRASGSLQTNSARVWRRRSAASEEWLKQKRLDELQTQRVQEELGRGSGGRGEEG